MSEKRSDGFKAEVDKQELSDYGIIAFAGEIVCVEEVEDVDAAVAGLKRFKTLGFDTETRPSFKKGKINSVSLLQLSAGNRVYLFRLNSTGLPPKLASLLANRDIVKVGVAIHDDIKALQTLRRFTPDGFVELQDLVKEYGIVNSGLKKLSAIILGATISKRQQISNWERPVLSQAQKIYAATDAWVCLKIYERLMESDPLKGKGKNNRALKEKGAGSKTLKEKSAGSKTLKEKSAGSSKLKEKGAGSKTLKEKGAGSKTLKEKSAGSSKLKEKGAGSKTLKEKGAGSSKLKEKGAGSKTLKEKGAGSSTLKEKGTREQHFRRKR